MAQDQSQITQDTVFDVLSSARRRYVLYYLQQSDDPVDINELARQVAAWENDTDVENLTDQQRKRVYISLYQTHLPKLDSIGIVEYDKESGEVALTDKAHVVDSYLDGTESIPWQTLYMGLSALSAILLALVWFEVGVFGTVPAVVVGLVITAGFAVSAITHYLYWRRNRQQIPSELEQE